jgi:vacuolar-type H+-ATPase subunit H
MPSESEILQHLLEAERKAKELVSQAEGSVAEKIENVKRSKEEHFRLLREQWQREMDRQLREYREEKQKNRNRVLEEKKKQLEAVEGQWEDACRVLKSLLGIV